MIKYLITMKKISMKKVKEIVSLIIKIGLFVMKVMTFIKGF